MTFAFVVLGFGAILLMSAYKNQGVTDTLGGVAAPDQPTGFANDSAGQALAAAFFSPADGTGGVGDQVGSALGTDPTAALSSTSGGVSTGGVIGKKTLGRIDQGVDFSGAGAIPAYADGVVTRVVPRGGASGWPGGGFLVMKLDNPPDPTHQYVYVAENISPAVKVGQRVTAGETIAHAYGTYPFLETGWAADAHGTTLSSAHGTQNTHPNHSNTPEGFSFLKWLGLG